ncbi:hypothetical protein BSL78_29088 [Apostichopus japonicus]|uniref:Uncharacterized protein n=1 Tax=Stichopus japonicus TaxID=307972 RepID=A0A2G8JEF2_STIJA|nr:hypothetical protein BSL78_29088 [Apostichopus japonicus]
MCKKISQRQCKQSGNISMDTFSLETSYEIRRLPQNKGIEVILGLSEGLLQRGTSVSNDGDIIEQLHEKCLALLCLSLEQIRLKIKTTKDSTSAPAPPVNTDVIPGRFTENDCVREEDGEEFVIDVVADIVDSAINVIYDNYIQKQLYPYVVDKSRELFLHIIEQFHLFVTHSGKFLARDKGEANPVEDETWAEEDEPLPSVPDAWAQGSVPYQALPPVSPTMSEHDTEVTSISRISNPEVLEDLPSTLNETGDC